ncbi:uncharacterized protein CFAP90 isoform X1 [Betta splendens]|uniref:Uncharacterized protein CFAP90 isoform X1 n=1 Tax=Betta splendens TaxID=158456 RepID=A0A8M1HJX1_BETSP|nr:uncharacterized protein CFAP90 isoform X1 [Betta splendens]
MDLSDKPDKPLSTLSSFSYIPPRRNQPKEMSYFKKDSEAPDVFMYDRVYNQAEGYDMRLHRDDRKHFKGSGLRINEEEDTEWRDTHVIHTQHSAVEEKATEHQTQVDEFGHLMRELIREERIPGRTQWGCARYAQTINMRVR